MEKKKKTYQLLRVLVASDNVEPAVEIADDLLRDLNNI